jgi:membrane fusion protein
MHTEEPLQFRPAALAAAAGGRFAGQTLLARRIPMRAAAGGAGVITVAAVLFLTFGHYTRKVHVTGQLVPVAGSIKVVAATGGRITRTYAQDGETVRAGQPLFDLSTERDSVADARIAAQIVLRRAERDLAGHQQIDELREQARALDARARRLRDTLDKHNQQALLQQEQVNHARDKLTRFAKLAKRGFVSPAQLHDLMAALQGQKVQQAALEESALTVQGDLEDVREAQRALAAKVTQAASGVRQELALLDQEAAEHEARSRVRVLAPVAGTVTALVSETGQSVPGGATLATVLPTDRRLEARLVVPSRGVAGIAVGQHVLLRVDAFPYQKFGAVDAVVAAVDTAPISEGGGAVTLYRVTARLARQSVNAYGQEQQFKAGMTLDADIHQDRRRLVEWLFEPLASVAKDRAR